MVIINLVDRPYFFIKAIVSLIISLDKVIDLAIGKTILIEIDVIIGFLGLLL